ncbi:MAG: outer membrane beta-barrel protein [Bacteroidales bacterium]|nr:outer membrane beta-barrel protein [Bacteroidales bacterium]
MLYNAEEPVSPGVWSAVAAGLDARKRVVPAWLWGAVAFAAAAAVAVGVFLWRPSTDLRLDGFTPASPLAARLDSSLPGGVVMPSKALSAPERKAAAAIAVREEASLEAVPEATINPEPLQKLSSRLAMPPQNSYVAKVDDNYLLNELAWEARPLPGRDISLLAGGNFQANSRAQAFNRRGAAAAAAVPEEGVYNPNPESDKPGFPFSVGLGLRWNFAPRWAVGTGVNYTNFSRSFTADYKGDGYSLEQVPVDNMQHWLGLPINFYFDIVRSPRWRVHAIAGGEMDYLLANSFTVHGNKPIPWQKKDVALQWSAGLGAGAEFMITPRIGVYLNPMVRYYFTQAGGADINGLPVHPVRFMMEGGLRFSLGSY